MLLPAQTSLGLCRAPTVPHQRLHLREVCKVAASMMHAMPSRHAHAGQMHNAGKHDGIWLPGATLNTILIISLKG